MVVVNGKTDGRTRLPAKALLATLVDHETSLVVTWASRSAVHDRGGLMGKCENLFG